MFLDFTDEGEGLIANYVSLNSTIGFGFNVEGFYDLGDGERTPIEDFSDTYNSYTAILMIDDEDCSLIKDKYQDEPQIYIDSDFFLYVFK